VGKMSGLLRTLARDQPYPASGADQTARPAAPGGAYVDGIVLVIEAPDEIDAETGKGCVLDETKWIGTEILHANDPTFDRPSS